MVDLDGVDGDHCCGGTVATVVVVVRMVEQVDSNVASPDP